MKNVKTWIYREDDNSNTWVLVTPDGKVTAPKNSKELFEPDLDLNPKNFSYSNLSVLPKEEREKIKTLFPN